MRRRGRGSALKAVLGAKSAGRDGGSRRASARPPPRPRHGRRRGDPVIGPNEAAALGAVEPLDGAGGHRPSLPRCPAREFVAACASPCEPPERRPGGRSRENAEQVRTTRNGMETRFGNPLTRIDARLQDDDRPAEPAASSPPCILVALEVSMATLTRGRAGKDGAPGAGGDGARADRGAERS
jgi:hypothetical protein